MIQEHLKAFWWLEDHRIGGMGRPGYNRCHWFELTIEEAILLSWLGKQKEATLPLDNLYKFIDVQGPRISPFYQIPDANKRLGLLRERNQLLRHLELMNKKTKVFSDIQVVSIDGTEQINVEHDQKQLQSELALLKQHGVSVIVSLLEDPFNHDHIGEHFDVHHYSIEDLDAPDMEQIHHYAELLQKSIADKKVVVTHCLAGIGRTTTMLIAAHLLHGHDWDNLMLRVKERNPYFQLIGNQERILRQLQSGV